MRAELLSARYQHVVEGDTCVRLPKFWQLRSGFLSRLRLSRLSRFDCTSFQPQQAGQMASGIHEQSEKEKVAQLGPS
jgi:hypothetical protein